MSQARFQKSQREKARKEKAAAKRERRATRAEEAATAASEREDATTSGDQEQQRVLAELAELHDLFEAGSVKFDDYEDRKRELLDRLEV